MKNAKVLHLLSVGIAFLFLSCSSSSGPSVTFDTNIDTVTVTDSATDTASDTASDKVTDTDTVTVTDTASDTDTVTVSVTDSDTVMDTDTATDLGCIPGDGIVCCDKDEDCTGQLTREGEDQCNKAVCEAGKCVLQPLDDTTACSDGDACTLGDHCQQTDSLSVCVAGTDTPDCEDNNPCTDDSCDPTTGCVHENNTATCDDGNNCTKDDTCSGGTCQGTSYTCNDDKDCTTDTCNGSGGCNYTVNNDFCLIDGHCYAVNTKSDNNCKVCNPTNKKRDWSNVADGTTCQSGSCNVGW